MLKKVVIFEISNLPSIPGVALINVLSHLVFDHHFCQFCQVGFVSNGWRWSLCGISLRALMTLCDTVDWEMHWLLITHSSYLPSTHLVINRLPSKDLNGQSQEGRNDLNLDAKETFQVALVRLGNLLFPFCPPTLFLDQANLTFSSRSVQNRLGIIAI